MHQSIINVASTANSAVTATATELELVPPPTSTTRYVNFADSCTLSADCAGDAFGTRISTEHLPGTPMEPANGERLLLSDSPDPAASTPPPPPTAAQLIAAAERRRSLSMVADILAKKTRSDRSPLAAKEPAQSMLPNSVRFADTDSMISSTSTAATSTSTKRSSFSQPSTMPMPMPPVGTAFSVEKQLRDQRKNSKQDKEGLDPESLMFRDGRRKIDMVLCYEEEDEGVMTEQEARRREQRRVFLENLVRDGLELELEDRSQSFDEKTFFVKVHMPWKTEARYAEVMNLKLPIRRFITISVRAWDDVPFAKLKWLQRWIRRAVQLIDLDPLLSEQEPTFDAATAGGPPEEQ